MCVWQKWKGEYNLERPHSIIHLFIHFSNNCVSTVRSILQQTLGITKVNEIALSIKNQRENQSDIPQSRERAPLSLWQSNSLFLLQPYSNTCCIMPPSFSSWSLAQTYELAVYLQFSIKMTIWKSGKVIQLSHFSLQYSWIE